MWPRLDLDPTTLIHKPVPNQFPSSTSKSTTDDSIIYIYYCLGELTLTTMPLLILRGGGKLHTTNTMTIHYTTPGDNPCSTPCHPIRPSGLEFECLALGTLSTIFDPTLNMLIAGMFHPRTRRETRTMVTLI